MGICGYTYVKCLQTLAILALFATGVAHASTTIINFDEINSPGCVAPICRMGTKDSTDLVVQEVTIGSS